MLLVTGHLTRDIDSARLSDYTFKIDHAMRQRWIIFCLFIGLFADMHSLASQTNAAADQSTQPMRLNVSVDEVSLTFHAADVRGLPVTDLQLNDLTIYDNYKSPRKILIFRSLKDIPIRVGLLSGYKRIHAGSHFSCSGHLD